MKKITLKTKQYLKKYKVDDIIRSESKILFVLESPHTQEIKYGYPVAGSSGKQMTRFIYNNDVPFGQLVNSPNKYSQYRKINNFGLLNVCPAPMQKGALLNQNYNLNPEEEQIVKILEKLRINHSSQKHNNSNWNKVKKIVLTNFKNRLENSIKNNNIQYIIPCGNLATNYLSQMIEESKKFIPNGCKIIYDIPHPSRNQWQYHKLMFKLTNILKEENIM